MQLYATDQVSISSVRAESLRPGERFTVSAALGEELLKKLPHSVSINPPRKKPAPVSVKSVLADTASMLAVSQQQADEKLKTILQSITDAQADADAKIVDIAASVKSAQDNADAKLAEIAAAIVAAQTDADGKIGEINNGVDEARRNAEAEVQEINSRLQGVRDQEKPAPAPGDTGGQKRDPAPLNKAEVPPKNKSSQ